MKKGLKSLGRRVRQTADASRTRLLQRYGSAERTIDPDFELGRNQIERLSHELPKAIRSARLARKQLEAQLAGKIVVEKSQSQSDDLERRGSDMGGDGEQQLQQQQQAQRQSSEGDAGDSSISRKPAPLLALGPHVAAIYDTATADSAPGGRPGMCSASDVASSWSDASLARARAKTLRQTSVDIKDAVAVYSKEHARFADALETLLAEITALGKRIKERDAVCLQHDKHKTEVIHLSEKNDPKISEAERRFDVSRDEYHRVNYEVLGELNAMLESRVPRLREIQALFVSAQFRLWSALARSYGRVCDAAPTPARSSALSITDQHPSPSSPRRSAFEGRANGEKDFDDEGGSEIMERSVLDILAEHTGDDEGSTPARLPSKDPGFKSGSALAEDMLTSGLGPCLPSMHATGFIGAGGELSDVSDEDTPDEYASDVGASGGQIDISAGGDDASKEDALEEGISRGAKVDNDHNSFEADSEQPTDIETAVFAEGASSSRDLNAPPARPPPTPVKKSTE